MKFSYRIMFNSALLSIRGAQQVCALIVDRSSPSNQVACPEAYDTGTMLHGTLLKLGDALEDLLRVEEEEALAILLPESN